MMYEDPYLYRPKPKPIGATPLGFDPYAAMQPIGVTPLGFDPYAAMQPMGGQQHGPGPGKGQLDWDLIQRILEHAEMMRGINDIYGLPPKPQLAHGPQGQRPPSVQPPYAGAPPAPVTRQLAQYAQQPAQSGGGEDDALAMLSNPAIQSLLSGPQPMQAAPLNPIQVPNLAGLFAPYQPPPVSPISGLFGGG